MKPKVQALTSPAKRSERKAASQSSGPSLLDVLAEVHVAIEGVTGTKANDEQPLMEAGLDSLGKLLKVQSILCSPSATLYTDRIKGSVRDMTIANLKHTKAASRSRILPNP